MLFATPLALGKLASLENAPLHIKRHDITVTVAPNSSWTAKGSLEIKVNTDQGRAIMAAYRFPFGDERETMKITSAIVLEPTSNREIPAASIVVRDYDPGPLARTPLFTATKSLIVPFGDLAPGTSVKIEYEKELKQPRIAGLFSMVFEWGLDYPILAGTLSIESKEKLYFDISKAARSYISFSQGRQANGTSIWKADLKSRIYVKPEGEQGGILSTAMVPRLQVSNKNSWAPVLDVLIPKYNPPVAEAIPPELQKIIDQVKPIVKVEDRLNKVIELMNQTAVYVRDWQATDEGFTPQKLSLFTSGKRGDSKDFAYATTIVLRALGHPADVSFVWRQSPSEKLWIEDNLTTPSLTLFNHAIVRVNDQGKTRYFDPTNQIPFAEGFLSDVGGSWSLTLTSNSRPFERLPAEAPVTSTIKITHNIDLRPDASLVGSGTVNVNGPLAAELKQVYLAQGATAVEPYLRSLFGLAANTDSASPMIRVNTQDRRGRILEINFSYVAGSSITTRGPYREFNVATPGLAGVPLLANSNRATDVILSRNLTIESETKITGGDIADETNTSCLALTSFASLVRETKTGIGYFTLNDHVQFKTDRIPIGNMKTTAFQNEMTAYANCLSRTRLSVGPRPAFEKSPFVLSAEEVAALKKPIASMNLQDIKVLDQIRTPQLNMLISTKVWLAAREMLRHPNPSAQVILEYTNALMQTGRTVVDDKDLFLRDHVTEAARLFGSSAVQGSKTAKFHRVHALMLVATDRLPEALIALKNAMDTEKNQAEDSLFAGRINLRLGQDERAETWLKLASTQAGSRSTRVDALENLAFLRLRQRKIPEFIAIYRQAITESPRNAWLYYEFAKHLAAIRMWDLSIENSRKALTIISPFREAETVLAEALIRKAETFYYSSPGIPTSDPVQLAQADKLAVESIRYNRQEPLAYRIAGHVTFLKALSGDYSSLIATQAYFAKAIELGANEVWIQERYNAANQALEQSRPIAQIWAAYAAAAARNRVPANRGEVAPPTRSPNR